MATRSSYGSQRLRRAYNRLRSFCGNYQRFDDFAELERLPDSAGYRHELRHGELAKVPLPIDWHYLIQWRLRRSLEAVADDAGVVEFWVVDGDRHQIKVSTPDGRTITYKSGGQILLIFGGSLAVDAIFA